MIGPVLVNALWFILATCMTVFIAFKWRYRYWKNKNVPFLEPSVPFGNIGNVLVQSRDENITEIYKTAKSKGWKVCGFFMVLSPAVLIVDIELIKRVLVKDFQYFNDRGTYTNEKDDKIGCHLFALPGTKWRHLRAKLTPAFSSGKLRGMFQTLADCGKDLEQYLEDNIKPYDPVDIKTLMQYFSTDVVGSCVFGLECNSFKQPDAVFHGFAKHFVLSKWDTIMWLFVDNFPGLSRSLGIRQVKKKIADFFSDLVKGTIAYREAKNYVRKDLMQILIDIKNGRDGQTDGLTIDEIVAQTFLFFIAGSGSTSTTLTFALFELAVHSDVQDRMRAEILSVLAKHDNKVTYDSITEMKYMGQVVDEVLRLYPPARVVERRCIEDYAIPGQDVVLEKGTRVIVSIKGVHSDAEYWANPETFDPERFSDENRKTWNQYAHLPFGQGPRSCIAERFGRMQVKVGLTSVLKNFRVSLSKRTKVPLKMSLDSLSPAADGKIWLNLEKI